MKINRKRFSSIFFCFFALSSTIYASSFPISGKKTNRFEAIGALGLASIDTGNSDIGVTRSETDKLVSTNNENWSSFAPQLGVGFIYNFAHAQNYSEKAQWFPAIEPELNLYYLGNTDNVGDVWRFKSSDFNQMTYKMPFRSTRLMLDAALTIVTKQRFSLFAIAGIGNAWNQVSYSDKDNDDNDSCPNQRLKLNSRDNTTFVWEAGIGATYALNDRARISLEYLYADLGNIKTSSTGTSGSITAPVIFSPKFNLSTQTVLLGLHYAL